VSSTPSHLHSILMRLPPCNISRRVLCTPVKLSLKTTSEAACCRAATGRATPCVLIVARVCFGAAPVACGPHVARLCSGCPGSTCHVTCVASPCQRVWAQVPEFKLNPFLFSSFQFKLFHIFRICINSKICPKFMKSVLLGFCFCILSNKKYETQL
jgi:hypothetical protein